MTSQASWGAHACLCECKGEYQRQLQLHQHELLAPTGMMRRRYAASNDTVSSLTMMFTLRNEDPYNTLQIGALGLPLCFQVLQTAGSISICFVAKYRP